MQVTPTPSRDPTLPQMIVETPGAIRVNVAERYDVIIDFAKYNPGD